MAAGDYRIGLDGKFFHGPAGATATTEADNVRNVNLNLSKRTAEALRRGKQWVAKKPIATEATLEFEIFDIEGDAFLAAIRDAFMNDTRIALYPTDGGGRPGSGIHLRRNRHDPVHGRRRVRAGHRGNWGPSHPGRCLVRGRHRPGRLPPQGLGCRRGSNPLAWREVLRAP